MTENSINKNEQYRISKCRDEITKVLHAKFTENGLFVIWQKEKENSNRTFITEGHFRSFDRENGIYTVFLDDNNSTKMNADSDVYFLLKGQDFAFKTKLSAQQLKDKNIVCFQIPKEVRLKELRTAPRMYFDPKDFKTVNVTFGAKNKNDDLVQTTCLISNISASGVCIVVSKETFCSIKLDSPIELEGLGFFNSLENSMKAVVRNARVFTKKTIKSDESFAIGLEFQQI